VHACIKQGRPLSTCLNVYRRDGSLVWLQVLSRAPERDSEREREREPTRSPLLPLPSLSKKDSCSCSTCARGDFFSPSHPLFLKYTLSLYLHSLSTLLTCILSLSLSPPPLCHHTMCVCVCVCMYTTLSFLSRRVWNTRK
jgi:hypothetical protein